MWGRLRSALSGVRAVLEGCVCDFRERLLYSRSVRRRSDRFLARLPDAVLEDTECVFFLSTGRCGTKWITELLSQDPGLSVHHAPACELVYPNVHAFRNRDDLPSLRSSVLAARYDAVERALITERTYVETNRRITFFAAGLADVFERSRFVHLVRNPYEFIRSGRARGYYTDPLVTRGHISPDEATEIPWSDMDPTEKIAWNWNATNAFIETFKADIETSRAITFRSGDLFENPSDLASLVAFVGGDALSDATVGRHLRTRANTTPTDQLAAAALSSSEKSKVRRFLTIAERYGYEL